MKLFSTAMLLIFSIAASAQVSYGPKLGLNLTKAKMTNEEFSSSYKPEFFVGGFVNYSFAEKVSLQGELLYSREGGKNKRIQGDVDDNLFFSFLQLPLMVRYAVSDKFFAEAGPQIGYLLSAKEEYNGSDKVDIKAYYKKADIRFPLGVGYKFDGSGKGIQVNLRYALPFSDINKTEVGGENIKLHVFSLGVALAL